MTDRAARIAQKVSAALDVSLPRVELRPTAGGCINQAALFDVDADSNPTTYFVKWNDHPLPRQFEVEAMGLSAMRAASSGLRVPEPVAHADDGPGRAFLVLEYVPETARGPGFDEALGRGLAALHRRTSAKGFGFDVDGYCGATPQPNGWMPAWLDFFRERRLGHQLRLARERGMTASEGRSIERVIERLDELLDDTQPPSLLHGDLWSGNLHPTADGPGLIDPAPYFGHREAELGMMTLFGGFSDRVFASYDEAWPLPDGWRQRLDLYALYHVLNHYNLFGGGYGAQAVSIARRSA